ncbi:hypothetical protein SAMN05661093_04525 [Kibdelosporangium aridum]|uniref:FXSXX-COOH protein n=1 Tax=Kibdelosporangium aridum TaxID=2030 RepID=A0A1W2EJQ7_KIBAR|nr:hypothetical protein SAMN05661093_04525 [Kibdelosporangium aridum]
MAGSPATEVRTNMVDLTSIPLSELRSGRPQATVEAAQEWALSYAGGPDATMIQVQNQ